MISPSRLGSATTRTRSRAACAWCASRPSPAAAWASPSSSSIVPAAPAEARRRRGSDAAAVGYHGYSVSLSGDPALVGALCDDHAGGTDAGSAYVFRLRGASSPTGTSAGHVANGATGLLLLGASVSIPGQAPLLTNTHRGGAEAVARGVAALGCSAAAMWKRGEEVVRASDLALSSVATVVGRAGGSARLFRLPSGHRPGAPRPGVERPERGPSRPLLCPVRRRPPALRGAAAPHRLAEPRVRPGGGLRFDRRAAARVRHRGDLDDHGDALRRRGLGAGAGARARAGGPGGPPPPPGNRPRRRARPLPGRTCECAVGHAARAQGHGRQRRLVRRGQRPGRVPGERRIHRHGRDPGADRRVGSGRDARRRRPLEQLGGAQRRVPSRRDPRLDPGGETHQQDVLVHRARAERRRARASGRRHGEALRGVEERPAAGDVDVPQCAAAGRAPRPVDHGLPRHRERGSLRAERGRCRGGSRRRDRVRPREERAARPGHLWRSLPRQRAVRAFSCRATLRPRLRARGRELFSRGFSVRGPRRPAPRAC
ncbi:MAG: FG-GAP repeat protein [Planctomycetes bacterium]|nr:FG-GAP repeat protein [Planctomycetota bacterium]